MAGNYIAKGLTSAALTLIYDIGYLGYAFGDVITDPSLLWSTGVILLADAATKFAVNNGFLSMQYKALGEAAAAGGGYYLAGARTQAFGQPTSTTTLVVQGAANDYMTNYFHPTLGSYLPGNPVYFHPEY